MARAFPGRRSMSTVGTEPCFWQIVRLHVERLISQWLSFVVLVSTLIHPQCLLYQGQVAACDCSRTFFLVWSQKSCLYLCRPCGCGAGDSGCTECGCCKTCAGEVDLNREDKKKGKRASYRCRLTLGCFPAQIFSILFGWLGQSFTLLPSPDIRPTFQFFAI